MEKSTVFYENIEEETKKIIFIEKLFIQENNNLYI